MPGQILVSEVAAGLTASVRIVQRWSLPALERLIGRNDPELAKAVVVDL